MDYYNSSAVTSSTSTTNGDTSLWLQIQGTSSNYAFDTTTFVRGGASYGATTTGAFRIRGTGSTTDTIRTLFSYGLSKIALYPRDSVSSTLHGFRFYPGDTIFLSFASRFRGVAEGERTNRANDQYMWEATATSKPYRNPAARFRFDTVGGAASTNTTSPLLGANSKNLIIYTDENYSLPNVNVMKITGKGTTSAVSASIVDNWWGVGTYKAFRSFRNFNPDTIIIVFEGSGAGAGPTGSGTGGNPVLPTDGSTLTFRTWSPQSSWTPGTATTNQRWGMNPLLITNIWARVNRNTSMLGYYPDPVDGYGVKNTADTSLYDPTLPLYEGMYDTLMINYKASTSTTLGMQNLRYYATGTYGAWGDPRHMPIMVLKNHANVSNQYVTFSPSMKGVASEAAADSLRWGTPVVRLQLTPGSYSFVRWNIGLNPAVGKIANTIPTAVWTASDTVSYYSIAQHRLYPGPKREHARGFYNGASSAFSPYRTLDTLSKVYTWRPDSANATSSATS